MLEQDLLELVATRYPDAEFKVAVCGSGARPIADLLGLDFVQEVVANSIAIKHLHPEARTAIELGGQDAKGDGQVEGTKELGLVGAAARSYQALTHGREIIGQADQAPGACQLQRRLRTQRAVESPADVQATPLGLAR